ncbi:MAG: hypothetical protein ACUZ8N_10845 [Candidatus Scalindua sp.]
MYSKENVEAWIKAEQNLGLKKSVFITINGTTTQYYDEEEGEVFYEMVKILCKDLILNLWFENYLIAIKEKDKVEQFKALSIFNEIDEHPELATNDQLRRLKRIRESTHEDIYK